MDWTAHLDVAATAAAGCGLVSWFVPRLIGRLPEPPPETEPDPVPEAESQDRRDEGPKELYADIAARPGLARTSAIWAAVCGALVALSLGWSWSLLVLLPVVPVLVALAVVDFRTRLLPTVLVRVAAGLVVVGVVVAWLATRDTSDLTRSILGSLIAFVLFFLAWFVHPRGMGFGDVRLSGVLGLALGHLGWGQLFVGLYAGFLIFGLPGLFLAVVRRDRSLLRKGYPFGPFMILGALIGVLWGADLWARFTGA